MGDEHVGEVVALLQRAQKIDDLRLDDHVERARRLVEHHEGRLEHDGAGDRDALALAAGEFVRIAKARVGIEADVAQRADHALLALAPAELGVVYPQAFLDDVGNRHARRERAIRILEHDLHTAAEWPHFSEGQPGDRAAEKHDRSIRGDEPQNG